MLNWSLLQNLLIIAIACSSITVTFIQKTKKFCKNSKYITIYSLMMNMIFGILFSFTFASIDYIKSLWVGLFGFLGADSIYKSLEGKLAPYSSLVSKEIDKKNTTTNTKNNLLENNNKEDVIGEITYE